ncbi:MAG: roadblock/LC7 domain-containing protein [Moraxella osloensis]
MICVPICFQQILNDLNSSSADVEASALISTDGLMIASALPAGIDEDRVGAMSAKLLSLGVVQVEN